MYDSKLGRPLSTIIEGEAQSRVVAVPATKFFLMVRNDAAAMMLSMMSKEEEGENDNSSECKYDIDENMNECSGNRVITACNMEVGLQSFIIDNVLQYWLA